MPEPTADALKVWNDVMASPYEWTLTLSSAHARRREPYRVGEFTCANCPKVQVCDGAFAVFNTDGDCLKENSGRSILVTD